MRKTPKNPAPPPKSKSKSKSFIRTKEEQAQFMKAKQREEAALIAKIEAFFAEFEREQTKVIARAKAQAKAQKLSHAETEALIKQELENQTVQDRRNHSHAWRKHGKVAPVSNTGELRSELSRLLEMGKRD